jgi:hypothetical protein
LRGSGSSEAQIGLLCSRWSLSLLTSRYALFSFFHFSSSFFSAYPLHYIDMHLRCIMLISCSLECRAFF